MEYGIAAGMRKLVKTVCVLFIFALSLLSFASCSLQDGALTPEYDKPVFYLSDLPEIEPFEIPPEISSRYGGVSYNGELKPAGDYGKLYPYLGEVVGGEYWMINRYGLVDALGRIVVDPVYESAYYLDADAGYLCLIPPQDRIDPGTEDIWEAAEKPRKLIIAKADGSWVKNDCWGSWASISDDRIIINTYVEPMGSFAMYDFDGHLLTESVGYFGGFSEGLGVTGFPVIDPVGGSGITKFQYIDKSGEVVIPGPFLSARDFKDGEAVVSAGSDWDNELYGIIDVKGNYIVSPAKENDWLRYGYNGGDDYADGVSLGNDWRTTEYDGGLALMKGDKEFRFDKQSGQSLYGAWITDDIIALDYYCYDGYDKAARNLARTDIFDGNSGKVIKSFIGMQYSYRTESGILLFAPARGSRMLILNPDFEPQFPDEAAGFTWFQPLTDDIYQARTAFSSGLIKENGEWLVRVNISSID